MQLMRTRSCRIPADDVLMSTTCVNGKEEGGDRGGEESDGTLVALAQQGLRIDDNIEEARLVDSDEEDNAAASGAQEQGSDGRLVINGIEGRVALPGFDVGLMSRNAMKESLENTVQSFRSKSVVRDCVGV